MNRVKFIAGRICGLTAAALFSALLLGINSYADGKATVTVESAHVRSNASTSGTVVGGVNKNDVLDVISSETDSAGYTWYKVKLSDSVTGYIRSDLVTTEGVSSSSQTSTTTSTQPTPEVTLEQTVPTETEPLGASVTGDVRVRAGASTNHSIVTNAKQNTAVTVIGYATASDGKLWYQITYNSGTSDITGYIRSDYIKLDGELVDKVEEVVEPEPEEVPAPEPEPEEVYKDYEAVYDASDDTWYLNNYIEGNKTSIPELLEAKTNLEKKEADFKKELKKKKTAIGALVAVIVALLGLGVYAYISVRRWYYGADEDTEEPAHSNTRYERRDTVTTQPRASTSNVRVQTVGAGTTKPVQPTNTGSQTAVKQNALVGERLPDGSIRMPDGSIRKARVAVKLPDGSLRFEDGTIQKPDGTKIKPSAPLEAPVKTYQGSSSHESREIPYSHTSEANSDDDMEYGFLDLDDRMSE